MISPGFCLSLKEEPIEGMASESIPQTALHVIMTAKSDIPQIDGTLITKDLH